MMAVLRSPVASAFLAPPPSMAGTSVKHRLLATVGAPLMRWRNRRRLTILMFHGFTDREHTGLENAQHKHLAVQKFELFLRHLRRHYSIISLDHARDCLNKAAPLPRSPVVLTFDDGFRSNYTLAYPLLKKWQVPATIYLATEFVSERKPIWVDRVDHALNQAGKTVRDLIETKRWLKKLPQEEIEAAVSSLEQQMGGLPLDLRSGTAAPIYHPLAWTEILEMQASGLVSFGAHTHTHKIMGRCQDETVRQEVRRSKQIIEKETAVRCTHFCYPNGGPGDSSPRSEQILAEEGYETSVLALGGVNPVPCPGMSLDRLGITNGMSFGEFELTVCGFLPMVHAWRQRRARPA